MKQVRINNQIQSPEVRVVDETGNNLGVMPIKEALALADEKEIDLIEISPKAVPPITKLMEFGKWQYLENRKNKLAKTKSHVTETRSIQVKIGTGDHDLGLKAKKVGEFLQEGHRVKIELFLPGRSKYFDQSFLSDRLERLLKLIPVEYKTAEEPKKGPRGLYMIVEKGK